MVKVFSACAIVSTLALLCSAAPSEKSPLKPFSFEQWARDISENPTGDHLSPEEAIAAYNATIAATTSRLDSRAADPQVKCLKGGLCYVPDAVGCINYLARKGQTACRIDRSQGISFFCRNPQCDIIGESIPAGTSTAAPCNDVAATAGRIMDSCTQGNNVQGKRVVTTQPNMGLILENGDATKRAI